jgi:hypothetical protein
MTCSFLALVIILGIIGWAVLIYAKPEVDKIYSQSYIVSDLNDVALTAEEKYSLEELITKNKIVPLSMVYDKTLNYYDSLISVLGILIAVLGIFVGLGMILSYFSMKSKIKDNIDDEIKYQFTNIFFQDHLRILIKGELAEETPDWLKSKENTIAEIVEQIKNEMEKNNKEQLSTLIQADKSQKKGEE